MISALIYSVWGIGRKWRTNRATYVSVAVMSMLAFMSLALDKLSSMQLSAVAGATDGSAQLSIATKTLFGIGLSVSVLQLQILMARVLHDRRREYLVLSAIGTPRWTIVFIATVEHLAHVSIGAAFGTVGAVVSVALILAMEPAMAAQTSWIRLVCFSGTLPLLAVLPITLVIVTRYTRSGRSVS